MSQLSQRKLAFELIAGRFCDLTTGALQRVPGVFSESVPLLHETFEQAQKRAVMPTPFGWDRAASRRCGQRLSSSDSVDLNCFHIASSFVACGLDIVVHKAF